MEKQYAVPNECDRGRWIAGLDRIRRNNEMLQVCHRDYRWAVFTAIRAFESEGNDDGTLLSVDAVVCLPTGNVFFCRLFQHLGTTGSLNRRD